MDRIKMVKDILMKWNLKNNNKFITINEVIKDWERECIFNDNDNGEHNKMQTLYDTLNINWRDEERFPRGEEAIKQFDFIQTYMLIDAIEELYKEAHKTDGYKDVNLLKEKLDYVYYKQAETICINKFKSNGLNEESWGDF